MKKIKYAISFLCMMLAIESIAQTAKSAYFLDGTFHNFRLNPAMEAERGFFSLGLGNLSMGSNGNVGISHFLYPQDDHLTTFMSGTVDEDEFINRLPQQIRLGMNFDETLLACGFRMLGGYTSFSVSMHSNTSMALPKEFFEFAKKGLREQHYNFSGINMNSQSYATATLGYSREVYKGLRVGANLKYLMGLAYADVTFDKFNVELSDERWMIEGHVQAQAALCSEIYYNENEDNTQENLQLGSFSPTAHGFAVDLGVVYDMKEFVPGLTVSTSILDLGIVNWKQMISIQDNGSPIKWEGLTDATIDEMKSDIENKLENRDDKINDLTAFEIDEITPKSTNLNAVMYIGAEYNMPFYKPLSVAMLYGRKFSNASCGWDDMRAYVNIAPIKWFEASANISYSTFGTSWGWMLNFHPVGFSFFVGSDHMITKITPQYLPVNKFNNHFTLGVNFPVGKLK